MRQSHGIFPLTSASRPAVGPTQPPVQWVPGVKRGRGVMLTTHPLLVPRLRKSRSYTSCHPDASLGSITGPLYIFCDVRTTERLWRVTRCSLGTDAAATYNRQSVPNPQTVYVMQVQLCWVAWRENGSYALRGKVKVVLLHASGMSRRASAEEHQQRRPGQPRHSHHLTDGRLLTRFKDSGSVRDETRSGRPRSATVSAKCRLSPQKWVLDSDAPSGKSSRNVLSVEILSTGDFNGKLSAHAKRTSCRSYTAMTDGWNLRLVFANTETEFLKADFFSD
jgi:hypothetical protein